ncbi:MAG: MmcQ/YjbR family DNA-binding protein [Fimbriimonadaceae bacterium]
MTPLDTVREICLALPKAYEKLSHGSPSFFIEKGRQFCSFVDGHHGVPGVAVWIPAPPGVQESLVEEDPLTYFRPPYVGPSGWVCVRVDRGLDRGELAALIASAYQHAAR